MKRFGLLCGSFWLLFTWLGAPLSAQSIYHAAADGNLTSLTAYLKKDPNLLNARAVDGKTALHWTVIRRREEAARLLLKNGADPNRGDFDGLTPFHFAAWWGWKPGFFLMLENGADGNASDNGGMNALNYALIGNNRDLANVLRKRGVPKNLWAAAIDGDTDTLKDILEEHPDWLNRQDSYGSTPLHLAIASNRSGTVDHLLRRGADFHIQNKYQRTPLETARICGHPEILAAISEYLKGRHLETAAWTLGAALLILALQWTWRHWRWKKLATSFPRSLDP